PPSPTSSPFPLSPHPHTELSDSNANGLAPPAAISDTLEGSGAASTGTSLQLQPLPTLAVPLPNSPAASEPQSHTAPPEPSATPIAAAAAMETAPDMFVATGTALSQLE